MKAKRILSCFVAGLVLAFGERPTHGQGTVIRQHFGAADPLSEGFTLSMAPGGTVGPVIGDQGRDSWSIISAGAPAGYFLSLTPEEQATVAGRDLTLSATLRIVQSPNIHLVLYTLSQQFWLEFGSQPDGDPVVYSRSSLNPAFVLEGGGSGYHDYQIVYRAISQQVALLVDGVERVTDIAAIPGSSGWGGFWGTTQGSPSHANWNRVTLEIIPEPSSLALLGCGAVLLAGHWLRRFRKRK